MKEDAFGTMQLGGVFEKNPRTSDEFLDFIETAKAFRSTAATTKNDQSSRSHSICRIRIIDTESDTADQGNIMLVDLAGSEANSDTSQHSKERMIETREINKSLNVLKECITKRAQWSLQKSESTQKHIHIPYRSNKLTQVLKSALDVHNTKTCKTLVIACIAPSILDVAQSKNTLRYAETLKIPIPKAKPMPYHEEIPITWSNKDVQDWITKTVSLFLSFLLISLLTSHESGKARINPQFLAPTENGTQICRMSEDEFVRRALLSGKVEPEQARLLYFKLWSLHIDSRSLLNRPGGSVEQITSSKQGDRSKSISNGTQKKVIKPGTFFKTKTGDTKENFDVVMAMGLEKGGKVERWICAAVCLVDGVNGAHEMFVAKQVSVKASALEDEIILEYDSATRYYYVKE